MIDVLKGKGRKVLFSTIADLIPRVIPLLTTIFIVSLDTESRVVDYLFTLAIFNIAAVILNFGAQYQESTSHELLKQKLIIQFSFVLLVYLSQFLIEVKQFEEIFYALILGCVYAHVNEFRLRREGKVYKYFLAALLLVVPRAVCMFFSVDYYISSIISAVLLALFILVGLDKVGNKAESQSVFNFAFLTSVIIIIYQQIPSLFSITQGVDENERIEQIVVRILFGLMFLKTTLVVMIIRYNFKIYFNRLAFSCFLLSFILATEFFVSYTYLKYFLYVIIFFSSELIYAYFSAEMHKNYNYKSMSVDAFFLMSLAFLFSYFEFNLIQIYTFSSVGLVIFRLRRGHV
ncbi:hypothetical protein J8M20_11980 [Pseudoalteromonas luteoviolacea]|uniref:hypothetical protein n=1 Tax=Pseudoalteromonas luteoviolacea TaxID=43657 RepID=UPI001B388651|nr:hypothetical protein [Pseudoalteromonas luteoviolacea]MBQ4812065.1 hypothetical protein [Pseudoalteromonas luteoviolacea]